jgi:hypothetical protein
VGGRVGVRAGAAFELTHYRRRSCPCRNSRLWRIGPITNEMVKNGIAGSLGLPRSF